MAAVDAINALKKAIEDLVGKQGQGGNTAAAKPHMDTAMAKLSTASEYIPGAPDAWANKQPTITAFGDALESLAQGLAALGVN